MIVSIDTDEASDKVQHPFIIKTFNKLHIEGTYLNKIKAIYDIPHLTSYNGEKLKGFPQDQEECKDAYSPHFH